VLHARPRRPVAPSDVAELRELTSLAEQASGHPVVGDAVWRDLAHPSAETALVIARDDAGTLAGALHIGPGGSSASPRLRLSPVVRPDRALDDVLHALVQPVLAGLEHREHDPLELWVFGTDGRWDRAAAALGFRPERELRQLRVPLPLAEQPRLPSGVRLRTFRPGVDETTWIAVNNRAFVADPDQGGWRVDTLREREREPWFDPTGFLLAEDGEELAGFCWTKLHPPTSVDPTSLGEIYVIGVDPDHQGRGLGRSLTVAGLEDLHDRQRAPVGMLFVDATNHPAMALYEAIGFRPSRVDRAYAWD
jgi:mycothiol synthase